MFGVLQVIDRNLILKHVPPAHQNNKLKVFIVQYPVNYSINIRSLCLNPESMMFQSCRGSDRMVVD